MKGPKLQDNPVEMRSLRKRIWRFFYISLIIGFIYWRINQHGDTSGSPGELVKFDNEVKLVENKDNEESNIESKNKDKDDTLEKDTILVVTKEKTVIEATKQIVRATTTRKPQPGDNGSPVNVNVSLLSAEEKNRYDQGFKGNAFNEFASDLISLHRKVPDSRPQMCKNVTYDANLPQTSVIITFYNEAWSTLIRSIHSVLERSPPHLIKEIILVDDGSEKAILGKPLEDYIRNFPKVKLFRNKKRDGLVSARIKGYEEATAPILTFLDSHIECNHGWLEPLLDPIAKDETVSTFPTLDVIDDETLKYEPLWDSPSYGVFRWRNLLFNWDNMPPVVTQARKSAADNIRSPTMPGGLFSINKAYFQKLGTYDPEMKGWGGENLELSFKFRFGCVTEVY
ncbi:polypeptide N-acetylgalactosaminyltransferase 5 isoform X3 [Patella vulgata]|uniref:polypeptide N-acetylgalactosaminyltransferase 5 isoform X3 n=1 Tax=Patella vulgata TaxID=6465 RepID=UPI0024A8A470|nr:polypeptide N-acetylgalactosaminyltransferase 5 isoform X3 [Patella vulgata]